MLFIAGKYRLLCLIKDVETERMVKAYCRECGRQDQPDKFEQDETDLLCCSKVTKHDTRQLIQVLYSFSEWKMGQGEAEVLHCCQCL